jgi:hypothetical protein
VTPRRHLDDLFSAAYEDDLSPLDDARFHTHIQSCAPCAAAYAEFRATVEALHELPRAPMPHVVHLPSTPPVAERPPRPRLGMTWFNLGVLRRFPATASAGAIAVVLVIVALTHGAGTTSNNTLGSGGTRPSPVTAQAPGVVAAACAQQIVGITGAPPPVEFAQANVVADPAEPGLHLILATPSLDVTAGHQVLLYAQLSVPVATISNPGATVTPPPARAVRPCVSIAVGNTHQSLRAVSAASNGVLATPGPGDEPLSAGGVPGGQTDPLLSFSVPAGLAPGTELHIVASVPAGYGGPGSPPLTATLILTTH